VASDLAIAIPRGAEVSGGEEATEAAGVRLNAAALLARCQAVGIEVSSIYRFIFCSLILIQGGAVERCIPIG